MSSGREIGSLSSQREGSGPASWGEKWHTESALFYPNTNNQFKEIASCIDQFVVTGHSPSQPLLTLSSRITTLGSCFAAELRHFLSDCGVSSDSFWVPSGLNNTFALRDFIHWCVTGKETAKGYRYGNGDDGIEDWKPSAELSTYRSYLAATDVFVFTLGLAEVWEDRETGMVFWRGVPESVFKQGKHQLRLSTVNENIENLENIIATIRSINPRAQIIFTLSPVPLKATFSGHSCITADCVSKSTLRLALHQLLDKKLENVWYWPSFEIVKWIGPHLPYPVYGTDDNVVRHVSRYVVIEIIFAFIRAYFGKEIAENLSKGYSPSLVERQGEVGEPPKVYSGTIIKA